MQLSITECDAGSNLDVRILMFKNNFAVEENGLIRSEAYLQRVTQIDHSSHSKWKQENKASKFNMIIKD